MKPTLVQVVRIDGAASTALFLLAAVWIAVAVSVAFGRVPADPGDWVGFTRDDPWPALLTIGGTLGAIAVIAVRTRTLRRLLSEGTQVAAEVESADFHRGRGRIWVLYRWDGQRLKSRVSVRDTPEARQIQDGATHPARVDPTAPGRVTLEALW